MQSRTPPWMSRSLGPVVAFAEPLADAARFASHFSPPSLPCHGATRIATVHAICVCVPDFVMSSRFTVDATMKPRDRADVSSAEVGRPPGQLVAYPVPSTLLLTILVTRSPASFGNLFD